MAVLLECAVCYQRYTAPAGTPGQPLACPWCGAVPASSRAPFSAGEFPQLSPSRFPRRRRTLPALVWLVVGVGLGACVVLSVLVVRGSPDSKSARGIPDPAVVRESLVVRRSPDSAHGSDRKSLPDPIPTRPAVITAAPPEDRAATEMSNAPEPAQAKTQRWLSKRPPPIGDPDDDSAGLGLVLHERVRERMGAPPSSLDTDDREPRASKKPPPARPQDNPAAVAALTAAGIRCENDAVTGLVTRVDGSFRMTDALMPHVAKLPALVHLKLSFADVTDTGLTHVKDLTGLRELILNQTKVTDTGLAQIEKLVHLEKLDLEKTLVTDACLPHLKAFNQLKHVDLRGTKVTQLGADSLNKALPSAKIRQ